MFITTIPQRNYLVLHSSQRRTSFPYLRRPLSPPSLPSISPLFFPHAHDQEKGGEGPESAGTSPTASAARAAATREAEGGRARVMWWRARSADGAGSNLGPRREVTCYPRARPVRTPTNSNVSVCQAGDARAEEEKKGEEEREKGREHTGERLGGDAFISKLSEKT